MFFFSVPLTSPTLNLCTLKQDLHVKTHKYRWYTEIFSAFFFDGAVKGAVLVLGPFLSLFPPPTLCRRHAAFYIAAGCINAKAGPLLQQKVNRLAGGKGHCTVLFSARPLCVDSATPPTSPLVPVRRCLRVSEPAQLPQEGHQKLAHHSFMGKQTIFIMNTSTVILMLNSPN